MYLLIYLKILRCYCNLFIYLPISYISIYLCQREGGPEWVLGAQNWQSEVSFSTLGTHTHTEGPSSHVSSPVCQITQHVKPLRAWKTFWILH